MLETFVIWAILLIIDVVLCIKIIPLFGMLFGIINLVAIVFIFFPDTSFNVYYTFISGLMAVAVIAISAIKVRS
jgi:hypothetical protein